MKLSRLPALLLIFLALAVAPARAGEAVRVENATRATLCAEEDNVYVRFAAPGIRRLEIRALHPPYVDRIAEDNWTPDFSHCDMSADPSFPGEAKRVVLFEDAEWRLVGHGFGAFWRPATAVFRVGDRTTKGLHLVQLVRRHRGKWIEVLVLYPQDGYWRAKPLPPASLPDTAYGSSFLVGPVEEKGRPFVALDEIAFDRARLAFRLKFAMGGTGELRVAEASPKATRLDVRLPPAGTLPFAALRSMYVREDFADTAEAHLARADGALFAGPVVGFPGAEATRAFFTRPTPSRHNTSAPDLGFLGFGR